MKKVSLLILVFVFCFAFAIRSQAANPAEIKAYIVQLEQKMAVAKSNNNSARLSKLSQLLVDAKASLAKARSSYAVSDNSADSGQEIDKLKMDLEDFKADVNEAVSALSSRIGSVKSTADKGATVQGRAYIHWLLKDQLATGTYNQFDIGRVYVDFKKSLDQDAGVRFTTDISRDSSNIKVYLKYAYFTLGNFSKHVPWTGFLGLDSVTVGQSATHWIDFMQKHWKFRYVAKTLTDNYKLFSSADLGLAFKGGFNLAGSGLPRLEYHAIVMNGEGYKDAEANGGKDIGLTLMMVPVRFAKKDYITVAASYLVEDLSLSSFDLSGKTKKYTAMASYAFTKPGKGILFSEYAQEQEAETGGFALGGQYQILPATNLFGRHDDYKKSGSKYIQNIAGIEYNWGSNVKLALDYQYETKDGVDNDKVLSIHTRVKW